MDKAQISRSEYYLPEGRMTVEEMARITGFEADFIVEKIGVREKRVAAADEHPSDMAVTAARKIVKDIDPLSVDVLLYCGSTPVDYTFWVCGHKVQAELGLTNAFVFDLKAICAGAVYALKVAKSLILADPHINRVLIASGEKFSAICNEETYKNLSALRYADGGGAMLVERGDGYNEIMASHIISQGELNRFVKVPAGGTVEPASHETVDRKRHGIVSEDSEKLKDIFSKNYVANYRAIIQQSLAKSGLDRATPDYLILNQTDYKSTQRILEAIGFPEERLITTRMTLGHVGTVDQMMIFNMLQRQKELRPGDTIVMASSALGFSWGALALKFHRNIPFDGAA